MYCQYERFPRPAVFFVGNTAVRSLTEHFTLRARSNSNDISSKLFEFGSASGDGATGFIGLGAASLPNSPLHGSVSAHLLPVVGGHFHPHSSRGTHTDSSAQDGKLKGSFSQEEDELLLRCAPRPFDPLTPSSSHKFASSPCQPKALPCCRDDGRIVGRRYTHSYISRG